MEKVNIIATFYDQDYGKIIETGSDEENGYVRLQQMHGDIVVVDIKDSETGETMFWPFAAEIVEETEKGVKFSGGVAFWDKWTDICQVLEKAYLGKKGNK